MSLETIIRPFQTRDVTPPRRLEVANQTEPPVVMLAFGRNGSGKTMNGSYSTTVTSYMARAIVEKRSDSGTLRPFG